MCVTPVHAKIIRQSFKIQHKVREQSPGDYILCDIAVFIRYLISGSCNEVLLGLPNEDLRQINREAAGLGR